MTQMEPTNAPALSSQPTYSPATVLPQLSTPIDDIAEIYEVSRTVDYIYINGYRRIALQFPDELLRASTRVVDLLKEGLQQKQPVVDIVTDNIEALTTEDTNEVAKVTRKLVDEVKFYILADTSYGSCCVDEIAAEHAEADCIIHYGRACLSPYVISLHVDCHHIDYTNSINCRTSRLPVLHVFTSKALPLEAVIEAFKQTFKDLDEKIILMSSLPYITHLPALTKQLQKNGYSSIFTTTVIHDPSSLIPNRTTPTSDASILQDYNVFHIDEPLTSLILTLSARTSSVHVYNSTTTRSELIFSTPLLRRRYALLSHVRSSGVIGILVNTLSASNYLPVISSLKSLLKAHGKKSYLFVVGKVNAAKVANFAEVECWVVVGCWESSILDEGREFWRACVTPWEVRMALDGGEGVSVQGWRADFEEFLKETTSTLSGEAIDAPVDDNDDDAIEQAISDDESAPPTFDLRTGRYISSSTPLHPTAQTKAITTNGTSDHTALTKVSKNKSVAMINNTISPAAAFLQEKRVWTGLGSDYQEVEIDGQGAIVEEGRGGVARGYRVGENGHRT